MTTIKSIDLSFPHGVLKGIESIHSQSLDEDNVYGRKYYVLNLALAQFYSFSKLGPAQKAYTLSDHDSVKYKVPPSYFKTDPFDKTKVTRITVTHQDDEFYDYDSSKEGKDVMAFWLDFADHKLGGGVFGSGFLQEERMFCETPDLANAALVEPPSGPIETRKGGTDVLDVLKGSPTPVAITGVHRVIDTTGHSELAQKIDDLRNHPPTLMQPTLMQLYWNPIGWIAFIQPPVEFNVLAIAAPKLPSRVTRPDLGTFQDLFNTFTAGFDLAWAVAHANGKLPKINTGPIGCGNFNNSKYAVLVLQVLAASQFAASLCFWGYKREELDHANDQLKKITDNFTGNTIDDLLRYATDVNWPYY